MADQISTRTPCKYDRLTATTITTTPSGVLNFVDMTNISGLTATTGFGTHAILPNIRIQNVINIRGFLYDVWVRNNSTTESSLVHIALIRPKRSDAQSVPLADFFREHNASRDLDFNAPIAAQQYNTLKMNPDAFDILMHRKKYLSRAAGTGTNVGAPNDINYKRLSGYIPYKKPYTFDDDAGTPQNPRPIYFVLWLAPPVSWSGSPLDKVTDIAQCYFDCATVFRDGQISS